MVREGFVALVNREADLVVCGECEGASEALALIKSEKPDVVVIDLILKDGDGLELIKSLRAMNAHLAMLVVSMQDEEIYAERALRAGARGYMMKSSATDEFLDAIRTVLAGNFYISRKMNARILHEFVGEKPGQDTIGPNMLTDRELEIFQLIGAGLPTRDISCRLGISAKTVETHRENIKQKMGLKNATELVQTASQWIQHKPE